MKLIHCVLLLLCPYLPYAQALGIGSTVKTKTVTPVYNAAGNKLSLAPKKGQLRIIHFLATGCKPCIAFVKQWQALQQTFGDSLQVLLVTREKLAKLQSFEKKHPGYFGRLPVAYSDTALENNFPYQSISHLVWINDAGKVAAITDSYYATENNIRLLLKGTMPNWPVKNELVGFDKTKPLLQLNASNIPYSSTPAFTVYSSFMAHMPDMHTARLSFIDSAAATQRISSINQTIPNLYTRTLRLGNFPASHIIINAPNKDFYVPDNSRFLKAGWELYNTYCYEITAPLYFTSAVLQQKMLDDISFHTGTQVRLIDSLFPCLVLKDTATRSMQPATHWKADTTAIPIDGIIANSNALYFAVPIIDERTNKEQNFIQWSLPLTASIQDKNRALLPYGFTLAPALRKIKLLIITQQSNQLFSHSPKLYAK